MDWLKTAVTGLCVAAGPLMGCDLSQTASSAELREAVDVVVEVEAARSLEDGIVEITTSFTLGQGLESVLAEVRAFAASQAPCSTVTAADERTLVIDFGDLADSCVYRGQTYAGIVTVEFTVRETEVVVEHRYDAVTNGRSTLDGSATVTWTQASRRVETRWTHQGPSGKLEGQSDHTQTLLGELGDGIRVDGWREWTGEGGTWMMAIDAVEMRAIDPVPQSGRYELETPAGKTIEMVFERLDNATIEVSVSSGRRKRSFRVTAVGQVSDASVG